MLLVAHRLSTVRNAHAIHVLQAGTVAESGTYDQLVAVPGPFRALVAQQLAAAQQEPEDDQSGDAPGEVPPTTTT